jgi:hypothetical protein
VFGNACCSKKTPDFTDNSLLLPESTKVNASMAYSISVAGFNQKVFILSKELNRPLVVRFFRWNVRSQRCSKNLR